MLRFLPRSVLRPNARRLRSLGATPTFAASAGGAGVFSTITAIAANVGVAPPLVELCNDAAGAGLEVRCTIDVVNYLNANGTKAASPPSPASTVTVTTCIGPAGAPICAAPVVTTLLVPVSTIRQCNATLAGGGRVVCSASITNHFVVAPGAIVAASVFQCDASFAGGGIVPGSSCLPVNTPGIIAMGTAVVDQCDGSGNGGGAFFTCTVTASTVTAAFPVRIDQCNGSNAGGGTTTICTAFIVNDVVALPAPPPVVVEDAPPVVVATVVPVPVAAAPITPPMPTFVAARRSAGAHLRSTAAAGPTGDPDGPAASTAAAGAGAAPDANAHSHAAPTRAHREWRACGHDERQRNPNDARATRWRRRPGARGPCRDRSDRA